MMCNIIFLRLTIQGLKLYIVAYYFRLIKGLWDGAGV